MKANENTFNTKILFNSNPCIYNSIHICYNSYDN